MGWSKDRLEVLKAQADKDRKTTSRPENQYRQEAKRVLEDAYHLHEYARYTFDNGAVVYPSIDQALKALEIAAIRIAARYGSVGS